jgi:uncharacterized protein YggE
MADRTVSTTAVGGATDRPDRAELVFAVEAADPEPAAARRAAAEQSAALGETLRDAGVPEEAVRTGSFRIGRRQRRPPHPGPDGDDGADPEQPPYVATETVEVGLDDPSTVGDVLAAAVDDAGVGVEDVRFTFTDDRHETLLDEAIRDAVAAARRNAEAAAAAEGESLGAVRKLDVDERAGTRRSAAGLSDTAESAGPSSGPMEVVARAEATFELG